MGDEEGLCLPLGIYIMEVRGDILISVPTVCVLRMSAVADINVMSAVLDKNLNSMKYKISWNDTFSFLLAMWNTNSKNTNHLKQKFGSVYGHFQSIFGRRKMETDMGKI